MPQRRHAARAALSGAAAAALISLATPAWASSTVPLHSAHRGSVAADFQQQCADTRFADRPADHDGWHFVLPGGPSVGGFESLTLTFDNGSGTVNVTVPDTTDAYPDALYPAGNNGRVIHAYLFTPAGWTLVDGSATISGQGARFNLSHTCAGQPTPESPTPTPTSPESPSPTPTSPESPTPTPTTPESPSPTPTVPESPTPTAPESPVPSDGTGGGGGDDGDLPVTGAAVTTMAVVGVGLIGGGVALVTLRRRRDRITFTS
ncbi:LPXTG cell wall anchor domain-containing protein [Verrucosispora sp. WMMA2044]|uniref:LPXTG cell wall anchor domain-containing protein n=1 Tax=Verrucosispora sp. WMMA2044 TaxID=3016419 RepID=UPI00248AAC0B|nr:LPXTG cell wall anchor domain-containing protein [Verrucosispora sp. WMMA2044]WBB46884.1 LPXTG cell wall anchor domain-containing protein [Verrucosispora sp. WMMA2044]